jgi:hypothetical protein
VPSHRADTPADAPTALRTRPSAHPAGPPLQRRRDRRTRSTVPAGHGAPGQQQQGQVAGLDWLHEPAGPALPPQWGVPGSRVAAAWAAARPAQEPTRPAEEPTSLLAAGWPQDPPASRAPAEPAADPAPTTGSVDVEAIGALALDPLFLATPSLDIDAGLVGNGLVGNGPLPPVQPLQRPRGKARAQAQTTRRAAKVLTEREPRRGTAALPQAGIAGALGIATIAVPLAGALGPVPGTRPSTAAAQTAAAAALTPLPPVPLVATPPLTALADRRLPPDGSPAAEVPNALAAPRIRVTASGRASRSTTRSVLPGCDGKVPGVHTIQNGRLPASTLCTLWDPKRQLRSDAAVAIAKLNVAYVKRFGHPMCFNDAYRSLAQQYRIKALRGGYAARPGTSEHGWGLAVDLCDGVDEGARSATYGWLRANAPAYGWENPTWARPGGSGPYEPWHWEYMPGEQGQSNGD